MTKPLADVERADFEDDILRADRPVLVLFYADWCERCDEAESTLEEIAEEYGDTIVVRSVDIERSSRLANQYHVAEIPTILGFYRGNRLKRLEQPADADDIEAVVDYFLDLPRVAA